MSAQGKCRSCHQPILWAITPNGKNMPLDPVPDDKGSAVWARRYHPTGSLVLERIDPIDQPTLAVTAGEVRYMPHHATCRDKDSWRRRTR